MVRHHWRGEAFAAAGDPRAAAEHASARDHLVTLLERLDDPALAEGLVNGLPAARQVAVAGPRHGAPLPAGSPLPAGQERATLPGAAGPVEVVWTPRLSTDPQGARGRRVALARLVTEAEAQGARPRPADLAVALGASVRTVQRDLSG